MNAVLGIFSGWILSALFVVACIIMLLSRKSEWNRLSLYGILAFGSFLFFGSYSILQSRSSTAGLGFIFLPIIALIPGGIGLILGKIHTEYFRQKQRNKPLAIHRSGLIIFSLLILMPFIWQANVLLNTISKNNLRDIEVARQRVAIENNINKLKKLLSENPGREVDILKEKADETEDRVELIPIAKNEHASSEILNELSRSADIGIVLTVVGNQNTSEKTLEWLYINNTYPAAVYPSLSSNPKTPKKILRELYEKRHQYTLIAWQLARNPELPEDILNKLVNEPRGRVLLHILGRSDITCEQVKKVINTLEKLKDTDISWLIDLSEKRMESCIQFMHS